MHSSEAALLRALHQVPALVAILRGPDLVYEYVNAAYVARVPIEAALGKPFGSSTHDRSSEMRAIMQRVYERGEPASFREVRLAADEGRHELYDIHFVPLHDASGAVDGVMIHAVEVTIEKQLHRIADANLIGIGYFMRGKLIDANDELLRIIGYDREDLRADRVDWNRLTPPEYLEASRRAIESLMAHGSYDAFEKEYIRKDGKRVSVLVGGVAFDAARTFGAAFVLDLTERKEAERLQAELLHVQKLESLGVLAGGIAHDFNNLLTIVLGNVSTALAQNPKEHDASEPLREATTAITRAAELTRQLLAYAGKGRFRVEPVDLSEQVRRVSALLRASVPKSIDLVLDLDPDLPSIEADVSQLHQILMNLVLNGAESIDGPHGAVSVCTRVLELHAERPSQTTSVALAPRRYTVLEVRDTGRGMDEATRQRIFDPFFTTKFTGRGLGLASVLGIMRTHKGDIEVESVPGRGTTFRVLFPSGDSVAAPLDPEQRRDAVRGKGLALVVDDDDNVRRTTSRLIAMQGFDVLEASSGSAALEIFPSRAAEIAVVVVDMTMPGMGGDETVRALRALRGDVPIVVMSGYDETDARWLTVDSITTFLPKPFTLDDLARRLREVLPDTSNRAS